MDDNSLTHKASAGQVLCNDVLWTTARHHLLCIADVYSLARTSKSIWDILQHELYIRDVLLAKYRQRLWTGKRTLHPSPHLKPTQHLASIKDLDVRAAVYKLKKRDYGRDTALHHAAVHGYSDVADKAIKAALRYWPNYIDIKDRNKYTPIMVATINRQAGIVESLVSAGCYTEAWKKEATWCAAGRVSPLQQGFHLTEASEMFPHTDALDIAIFTRQHDFACDLARRCEMYLRPQGQLENSPDPLSTACLVALPAVARILLDRGVEAFRRIPRFFNGTAIHVAAAGLDGNTELLEMLLDCGASADDMDSRQRRPVVWAICHRRGANTAYLLERSQCRLTAASIPSKNTLAASASTDHLLPVTKFFLDRDDQYTEAHIRQTLLQALLHQTDAPSTIKYLLDRAISVNLVTKDTLLYGSRVGDGKTVLHLAIQAAECNIEVIQAILDPRHCIDVNARDKRGFTALDYALKQDRHDVMKALGQAGAMSRRVMEAKGPHDLCAHVHSPWLGIEMPDLFDWRGLVW